MPAVRSATALAALLVALPSLAADPRAAFHASKPWLELLSRGVVVRETWVSVDGTPFALVHAVRTAEEGFEGALFAVEAETGSTWPGAMSLDACPPLRTVRTMATLQRRGGAVLMRLGQGDFVRKPFTSCGELYRAGDLAACTVRVPVRFDAEEIASGPDMSRLGKGWVSAERGRVDVPMAPNAALKLTTSLRECIGDDAPVLARVEDRLALAGSKSMLLVSETHTSVCSPCAEVEAAPKPVPPPDDEVRRKNRAAVAAWKAGRRDEAVRRWRELYELWWSGPREPQPVWSETLEVFGSSLATMKEQAQARHVLEEAWSIAKVPSGSLMVNMGDVFRDLGDATAAITAYEGVLEVDATKQQRDHAMAQLAKLRQ